MLQSQWILKWKRNTSPDKPEFVTFKQWLKQSQTAGREGWAPQLLHLPNCTNVMSSEIAKPANCIRNSIQSKAKARIPPDPERHRNFKKGLPSRRSPATWCPENFVRSPRCVAEIRDSANAQYGIIIIHYPVSVDKWIYMYVETLCWGTPEVFSVDKSKTRKLLISSFWCIAQRHVLARN
jgi:hypothetical protein